MRNRYPTGFYRSIITAILAGAIGLPAPASGAETPFDPASSLRSRVVPPDAEIVNIYVEAGATGAKPHVLTDREWAVVETAIAGLPPLHRDILRKHLAHLSFIDAPSSAGTALTRDLDPDGAERRFDITIRADALEKSLTDFLNGKEAQIFEPDASGYTVHIDAGDAPALPYLLLHEATHVVDRTLGLTAAADSPFRTEIWAGYRDLAAPYDSGPLARTPFRRAPRVAVSHAPALYDALAGSPFVSIYATASTGEDLAELVAWHHLSKQPGARFRIDVRDKDGALAKRLEPLQSPMVQARFKLLDGQLADAQRTKAGDAAVDAAKAG